MAKYKDGKGDYYLSAGLRESRGAPPRIIITQRQLTEALRRAGIAPIGMSYEQAASHIWMELNGWN